MTSSNSSRIISQAARSYVQGYSCRHHILELLCCICMKITAWLACQNCRRPKPRLRLLQVDDIVDIVQDEVAQCDIPVAPHPHCHAYRASQALSGLELLGEEYRSLRQKHFGLAKHILRFFKQADCWSESLPLRHFRNVVRLCYPNLLVSSLNFKSHLLNSCFTKHKNKNSLVSR